MAARSERRATCNKRASDWTRPLQQQQQLKQYQQHRRSRAERPGVVNLAAAAAAHVYIHIIN